MTQTKTGHLGFFFLICLGFYIGGFSAGLFEREIGDGPQKFGMMRDGGASPGNSGEMSLASMVTASVVFPSYANLLDVAEEKQSEILVNPQNDKTTCHIVELIGPADAFPEIKTCEGLPDLCWTNTLAIVDREGDPTCRQAFRASEILNSRNAQICPLLKASLSHSEMDEVRASANTGEAISQTASSALIPIPLFGSMAADIDTISIDAACRCHYSSSKLELNNIQWPALERHCQSHFSEIYR